MIMNLCGQVVNYRACSYSQQSNGQKSSVKMYKTAILLHVPEMESVYKFLMIPYPQGHYNQCLVCESSPGYCKPCLGILSKHIKDHTEELLR